MRLCMHPPPALSVTAPPSLGPPWDLESAPCASFVRSLAAGARGAGCGEAMTHERHARTPRREERSRTRAFAIWRPVVHRVELEVNPPNRCHL